MNVSQHKGAFVSQFPSGTEMNMRWFEGRIEHVASGQLTHFYSREELIAFMERVLKQTRDDENRRNQILLGNSYPTLQLVKAEKETESE